MKRVAVVTDTIGSGFYFPLWYKYYGGLFGGQNIFALVPAVNVAEFAGFTLGGVKCVDFFDNDARTYAIASLCEALLKTYDLVIRVDTDEFLVADPYKYGSLVEYVNKVSFPAITARGYNLVPDRTDAPLDLDRPILFEQRRIVNPYSALSKTAIVSEKTWWAPGFHFCNHPPKFDDLLLIHLKLADIKLQLEIGKAVASLANSEHFIEYHLTPENILTLRLNETLTFPRLPAVEALTRQKYDDLFLSKFGFIEAYNGVHHGEILPPERVLVELDQRFSGLF